MEEIKNLFFLFFLSIIKFSFILDSIYIYIYICVCVYGSHGLVSIIICHSTNNSKDPNIKLEFSKSKRTIIVEKTKFLYWLSHFRKERRIFFLLIGIHIITNQQIRSWVTVKDFHAYAFRLSDYVVWFRITPLHDWE